MLKSVTDDIWQCKMQKEYLISATLGKCAPTSFCVRIYSNLPRIFHKYQKALEMQVSDYVDQLKWHTQTDFSGSLLRLTLTTTTFLQDLPLNGSLHKAVHLVATSEDLGVSSFNILTHCYQYRACFTLPAMGCTSTLGFIKMHDMIGLEYHIISI